MLYNSGPISFTHALASSSILCQSRPRKTLEKPRSKSVLESGRFENCTSWGGGGGRGLMCVRPSERGGSELRIEASVG